MESFFNSYHFQSKILLSKFTDIYVCVYVQLDAFEQDRVHWKGGRCYESMGGGGLASCGCFKRDWVGVGSRFGCHSGWLSFLSTLLVPHYFDQWCVDVNSVTGGGNIRDVTCSRKTVRACVYTLMHPRGLFTGAEKLRAGMEGKV